MMVTIAKPEVNIATGTYLVMCAIQLTYLAYILKQFLDGIEHKVFVENHLYFFPGKK
jgi:hypothetical protein